MVFFKKKGDKEKDKGSPTQENNVEDKGEKSIPKVVSKDNMSQEEIEALFTKLLHALGLPSERMNDMMKWDDERKLQLINQHINKGKTTDKATSKKLDPQIQIHVLKNLSETTLMSPQEMRSQMGKVRQCITSSLVGWVAKFLAGGGFSALLDVFRKAVILKPPNAPVIAESVMILKALMNTPAGMKAVVETPAMYKLIITSIANCGVANESSKDDVATARQISQNGFDVLTAVGLVPPDGHRLVLESSNNLDKNPRFYWLLRELWANIEMIPESNNLLVSGMSLINVIVNSPDELRVRVVLRNELFAMGLDGLLDSLAEAPPNEKLTNQLSTFTYLHEDDMYELETRFGAIARDPVDLVRQLIRKLERTPVYTSLVSVLHNLATISGGRVTPSKIKCWRHIETSINRIVLHDIGSTMDVDIAHLSSILNRNEFGNNVPTPWADLHKASNRNSINSGGWRKVDIHGNKSRSTADLPRSASEGSPTTKRRSQQNRDSRSLSENPEDADSIEDEIENGKRAMKSMSMMDIPSRPSSTTPPPSTPPGMMELEPILGDPPEPPGDISDVTVNPPTPNGIPSAPNGGPKPPPPPPPGMNRKPGRSFLTTAKPTAKTKTLQWKKVPENKVAAAPFWSKATHLDLAADASLLESLFAAKEAKALGVRKSSSAAWNEENGATSPNGVHTPRLSLLDPKRANNIEIMLNSRLKKHPRVIAEAIATLNDSILDAEGVNQVLRILPGDDELKKLNGISQEDIPRLGKAEVFVVELLKVPRLQSKLECWKFMSTFESTIEDVLPALSCVRTACDQIVGSKKFAYILQMVLALGNFLNFGNGQGNALGFKLDGLTKLKDVKTTDNKANLLNVLANVLESRQPAALGFFHDILAVEEARKVSISIVKAKVQSLRVGYGLLTAELQQARADEEIFKSKLVTFTSMAKVKIEDAEAKCASMEKHFNALLTHFGEDPATQSEDLFEMLAKFATMLSAAHADNESRKRREAYQQKRLVRQQQRTPSPENSDAESPSSPSSPPPTLTGPPALPPNKPKAIREQAHALATAAAASNAKRAQESSDAVESMGGIDSILQGIHHGGVQAIVSQRRPTLESDVPPKLNFTLSASPKTSKLKHSAS